MNEFIEGIAPVIVRASVLAVYTWTVVTVFGGAPPRWLGWGALVGVVVMAVRFA